jgi:UPF0716 family protein affecting phage T7 exclusion
MTSYSPSFFFVHESKENARTQTGWLLLAEALKTQKPLVGRYLTRIPGGFTVSLAGLVCFLPFSRSSMRMRQKSNSAFSPQPHLASSNPKSGFFSTIKSRPEKEASSVEMQTQQKKRARGSSLEKKVDATWSLHPSQVRSLPRKRHLRDQGILTQECGSYTRVQKMNVPFKARGFMGQLGLFRIQKLSGPQIVVVEDFSFDPSFFLSS